MRVDERIVKDLKFLKEDKSFFLNGHIELIRGYCSDFEKYFWGENILGVTAIVGKNGSGKTKLLDAIAKNANQNTEKGFKVLYFDDYKIKNNSGNFSQKTEEIKRLLKLDFLKDMKIISSNKLENLQNEIIFSVIMLNNLNTWDQVEDYLNKEKYTGFHDLRLEYIYLNIIWNKYSDIKEDEYNDYFSNSNIKKNVDSGFEKEMKRSKSNRENEIFQNRSHVHRDTFILDAFSQYIPLFFEVSNLSRGEFSFINQYIRLKYYIEHTPQEIDKFLLIFDEPDARFHPEWSRIYVDFLMRFLDEKIFEGKKFQIILSTHSPFLLSDFTDNHVIGLEETYSEEENSYISKIVKVKENGCFSAEVYDILKNTFFLEKFRGEHADKKLKQIKKEIHEIISSSAGEKEKLINRFKERGKVVENISDVILRKQFEMLLELPKQFQEDGYVR